MFDYEQFVAKCQLYFKRAADAEDAADERALWLLLGLEFLLRAPLARIHPTLLAAPEGDSILHAAGVERARGLPKSIPTKTVIDRLTKVDPNFGEDRGKDAAFLTELRNEEVHSSSATLANAGEPTWMPRFLDVVEALCAHLDLNVTSLLDADIVQAAETYRGTADRATQGLVAQLSKAAKTLFGGLTASEVATRAVLPSPTKGAVHISCPVCGQDSAWLVLSGGWTSEPRYDEDAEEISYKLIRVANALDCTVCGISLSTSAQVIAAGVDRLYVQEISEDRYEGWEERITYSDAMSFLGAGEDYGND